MKFNINNTEYEIIEKEQLDNEEDVGYSDYQAKQVILKKLDKDFMIRTLKHELTHIWLYEYGHNQDEKEFSKEDVCEILSCSNDFINEVVNKYLGIKPLYLCDKDKNTECNKKNCDICMMTDNIKFAKRYCL